MLLWIYPQPCKLKDQTKNINVITDIQNDMLLFLVYGVSVIFPLWSGGVPTPSCTCTLLEFLYGHVHGVRKMKDRHTLYKNPIHQKPMLPQLWRKGKFM